MEFLRTFIAIELPHSIKTALGELQASLKINGGWLKWVDPGSMHLTLKFLGDTPTVKLKTIAAGLKDAADGIGPFQLKVSGLGAFPNLNRIQVVWAGLTGDLEKLAKLQEQVEFHMAVLDFPEENRGFTPHLTLARVRERPPAEQMEKLSKLLSHASFCPADIIHVRSIDLIKSQLTPRGAIYNKLDSVTL